MHAKGRQMFSLFRQRRHSGKHIYRPPRRQPPGVSRRLGHVEQLEERTLLASDGIADIIAGIGTSGSNSVDPLPDLHALLPYIEQCGMTATPGPDGNLPQTAALARAPAKGNGGWVCDPDTIYFIRPAGHFDYRGNIQDVNEAATTYLRVLPLNEPPAVFAGDDATIVEGQTFSGTGTFSDSSAGPWTATVDYGDGSGEQPQVVGPDKTFVLNHIYTDDGVYTAKVRVIDEQGLVGSDTLTVTATNTVPHIGGTIAPVRERQLAVLQATISDANPYEPLVVTIDWGDRSAAKTFDLPPGTTSFTPTHRYSHDGQFSVTLTVTDDDLSVGRATVPANIQNVDILVAGTDVGSPGQVRVFDANSHTLKFSFTPYPTYFLGGVRVAVGDVNGDGYQDITVAPGAGNSGPLVKVFSGLNHSLLASFFAYSPNFHGGVFVAAGDLNADGKAEIITGAGPGAGPNVKVFDGATLQAIDSFFAYDPQFQGGVRVAVGDVNGDGKADITTSPGSGLAQQVRTFDGETLAALDSFFASNSRVGGLFVAGSQ